VECNGDGSQATSCHSSDLNVLVRHQGKSRRQRKHYLGGGLKERVKQQRGEHGASPHGKKSGEQRLVSWGAVPERAAV
jgi:hypothetical protein